MCIRDSSGGTRQLLFNLSADIPFLGNLSGERDVYKRQVVDHMGEAKGNAFQQGVQVERHIVAGFFLSLIHISVTTTPETSISQDWVRRTTRKRPMSGKRCLPGATGW